MSDDLKSWLIGCIAAVLIVGMIMFTVIRTGEANRNMEINMASQGYEQRLSEGGYLLWKKASTKVQE